jgi:hypothetical protein
MKTRVNFEMCEKNDHEDYLLNLVCIDNQCLNRGLICN